MGRSIQFGSRRNLTLGRTLERRIVDANPIEEPRRPSRRLDRLQDNGLALAPNGDSVPFQVEFLRQSHQLGTVGPYDLGNLHGILHPDQSHSALAILPAASLLPQLTLSSWSAPGLLLARR